jgi:hypothetical protein
MTMNLPCISGHHQSPPRSPAASTASAWTQPPVGPWQPDGLFQERKPGPIVVTSLGARLRDRAWPRATTDAEVFVGVLVAGQALLRRGDLLPGVRAERIARQRTHCSFTFRMASDDKTDVVNSASPGIDQL